MIRGWSRFRYAQKILLQFARDVEQAVNLHFQDNHEQ